MSSIRCRRRRRHGRRRRWNRSSSTKPVARGAPCVAAGAVPLVLGTLHVQRRLPSRGDSPRAARVRLHPRVAALLSGNVRATAARGARLLRTGVMIDVLVIGGGPAGSAAALRLAAMGCSVMLVERSLFPRPHVGESLSPGVWVHFETLGIAPPIQRAGFRRSSDTLLRWDGETRRVQAGRPSLIVDRARFDALMLDAARESIEIAQPVFVEQAS